MKIEINEMRKIEGEVSSNDRVAEVSAYSGLFISLGAIALGFLANWEEITKNQKTATFSLLAIAFFVAGLIASNTIETRRRFSSFLYLLAAVSSAIAVYVTFTDEAAPLQALALATVVTLLGYTVSPTIVGHLGLYLATAGTLLSLGFELVDSENLRLYTQISLVIAFAIGWMLLSSMSVVHPETGYALASLTIFGASQIALLRGYNNLSYAIALSSVALFAWLYFVMRSWILAIVGLIAFPVTMAEWVVSAMDSSMASLSGMFIAGLLLALISASSISAVKD